MRTIRATASASPSNLQTSRLADTFNELKAEGRKGLVPYITAGDPSPKRTVDLMHALVRGGADVIELGVPFSDPMADGPVIQLACERALQHGTGLWQVLDMVKDFRRRDADTPVVLMGYLNPIETRGVEAFARRAKACGVDGVLIVDLAAEEAAPVTRVLRRHGLDCVFLVAPNTAPDRIRAIAAEASGYLYYVSLKGVTGASTLNVASVSRKLADIRECTELPVAVGFGVRDARTAALVARVADAVVVGSALVSLIGKHRGSASALGKRLGAKLKTMRRSLDGPGKRGNRRK